MLVLFKRGKSWLEDAHYCTEKCRLQSVLCCMQFCSSLSYLLIYCVSCDRYIKRTEINIMFLCRLSEVREKISHLTDEMRQLDADMEEHQGIVFSKHENTLI